MPVTTNKIPYPQAMNTALAVVTAAKTTETDLTNAVLMYTAPTYGSIITKLTAKPRATVTASNLKIYICKSGAPTTPFLALSRTMAAASFSNTAAIADTDFGATELAPIKLGGGDLVYVSSAVALAGGIVFAAEIEEFA